MTKISAIELSELLQGEIVGNKGAQVEGISKIDQSVAGTLSFLANPKYESYLEDNSAEIVLVNRHIQLPDNGKTYIRVDDPYVGFCVVLNVYYNPFRAKSGIESGSFVQNGAEIGVDVYVGAGAYISGSAHLAEGVKIFPGCYIGDNVRIGKGTVLYSGVQVYQDCKIGSNVIIHSGSVIGSDGFGHAPLPDGTYMKIPQIGNVVIEDHVEIGANCTVDRATLGSTVIRKGVKLDNLIQVAHNVEIGANTVIAAQTGVSGSVQIGENCVIGGQVGFVGHIRIANGTQIGAQSGIPKAITEEGQKWIGSPIMPLKEAFKVQVISRKLPELKEKVERLEKELNQIKQQTT